MEQAQLRKITFKKTYPHLKPCRKKNRDQASEGERDTEMTDAEKAREDIPLHHLWSVSSQRSEGKRCQINPSCCNRAQQKHAILERVDHKPSKKSFTLGEERSKNGYELVRVTELDFLVSVCLKKPTCIKQLGMKSVWWIKIQRKQKHADSLWLNHSVIIGFPMTKCQSRFVSVCICAVDACHFPAFCLW